MTTGNARAVEGAQYKRVDAVTTVQTYIEELVEDGGVELENVVTNIHRVLFSLGEPVSDFIVTDTPLVCL